MADILPIFFFDFWEIRGDLFLKLQYEFPVFPLGLRHQLIRHFFFLFESYENFESYFNFKDL